MLYLTYPKMYSHMSVGFKFSDRKWCGSITFAFIKASMVV